MLQGESTMRIQFRQGLVRTPAGFLSVGVNVVSLVVPSFDNVSMTFADGDTDYLLVERLSVNNAWASLPGTTVWLYWDINTVTAERTFGFTSVSPVAQPTAPIAPANDQHWFDTSTFTMKVWSSSGGRWVRRIRVFACKLDGGTVLISMSINSPIFYGTQAGSIAEVQINAGSFVFDADGYALRKADGTFFTTEDQAVTSIASSSQVKFGSLVINAQAAANIAQYSVVRFTDYNQIVSANNFLVDNGAYGIVEDALVTGDSANVVMEGLITNAGWDFSVTGGGPSINDPVRFPAPLTVNTPLYVDNMGLLTSVVPVTPIIIAAVVDTSSILLRPSSLFMDMTNDPATTSNLGTVLLSVGPVDPAAPIVVGNNDPRITPVLTHIADATVHITAAQNTFLDSITAPGIVIHKADNTSVQRSLVQPAEGITITNADGQAGNPTFTLANDLLGLEGLTTAGLSARTAPNTWVTRSVVAPAAGITVTDGDGVAGNPTLVLANDLAGVEGLGALGLATRWAPDSWTVRTITGPAEGITVTDGDGVAGNPTLSLSNDLASIEGLAGVGFGARAAGDTWALRTFTAPAAGFSITPNDGTANPVFALTNDLAGVEGLGTTGIAVRAAADSWVTKAISASASEIEVTNGDGTAGGDIILGLPDVGTPIVDSLQRITTDQWGRVSGSSAPTQTDIETALGFHPVESGGDTMSGALDMGTNWVRNVLTPALGTDAANKAYVDSVATGLDVKASVRVASVADVNVSSPGSPIDGVAMVNGDRVLLKDQSVPTENGIYDYDSTVTPMTRSADFVDPFVSSGAFTFVEEGAVNANSGWVLITDDPITIGITSLAFEQFSGAGQITAGTGMTKAGNTLNVGAVAGQLVANASDLGLATTGITPAIYKALTIDAYGRATAGTNPTTLGGYGITDAQPLDSDLTAIAGLSLTGVMVRTGAGTASIRSVTGLVNEITVTNGDGVAGNIAVGLANNPVVPGNNQMVVPSGSTGQETGSTNGSIRYNSDTSKMRMFEGGSWKNVGTVTSVAMTPPIAGISIAGSPITGSGTFVLSLNGELAAIEATAGGPYGMAAHIGAGSWTSRTINGTASNIDVTNGSGLAGDPTVNLAPTGITPGVFQSLTIDSFGRATAGTNPSTLAGYGIVDAQPLDSTLTALAVFNTNGLFVQTAADTFTGRLLVAPAQGITIADTDGVAGNPTFALANDLAALEGLAGTGIARRTGADTWSVGTTVTVAEGGTDLTTVGAANQVLGTNAGATALEYKTVTAGVGVSVVQGVGSITVATQTLKASLGFTFGAIAANDVGDSSNTLTVTGAVVGDVVTLGLPVAIPAGFTYNAHVSAADTVTVRAHGSASSGVGAGAADATINVIVMKYASF